MRLPFIDILVIVIPGLLLDWRIISLLLKRCKSNKPTLIYSVLNFLLFYLPLILAVAVPHRGGPDAQLLAVMWMLYSYISILLAKILFVTVDALSLIPRIFNRPRCKTVSYIAVAVGLLTILTMCWGAFVNRFNIRVKNIKVEITDLPPSLKGFKIAQISDLHLGTFGNDTTFISQIVDSTNAHGPDLIVFTGDIVNRNSDEIFPFLKPLSRLKSPHGVLSILGNHDYGDYKHWQTDSAKKQNIQKLIRLQSEMGWEILLDTNRIIKHGADSMAIIGVENIGDPPFPTYGNLNRAIPPNKDIPWILLSHNPAHWDSEVLKQSSDSLPIVLTLSGHTHAMQMEILGNSPASLRYKRWRGLYTNPSDKRKLYVNIGAGTVGMPMRIGATPEITIITLQ